MPRLPFRMTMLTILLGMTLLTAALVAINSSRHTQFAVDDLTAQSLNQTTARIEFQIERLVERARFESDFTARQIETRRLRPDSFPDFVEHWKELLALCPELTSSYIGLPETGDSVLVSRLRGPRLSVWQVWSDPRPGQSRIEREFWADEYPGRSFREGEELATYDARERQWYQQAKAAGRGSWLESYPFLGLGTDVDDLIGLTYARPVMIDGRLAAVLGTDFDLRSLCEFFRGLKVGEAGYSFVVEHRSDGERHVIAHPRNDILVAPVHREGRTVQELVPLDQLGDPLAAALAKRLPTSFAELSPQAIADVRFSVGGVSYLGTYKRLDVRDAPPWIICTILPQAELLARVEANRRHSLLVGVMIFITALIVGIYFSAQVAEPLERLLRETDRVGHMDLAPSPVTHSVVLEVDRLGEAVEKMKTGLRSFLKYVPGEVVRQSVTSQRESVFGGCRKSVTVLFSDIVDFTAFAENVEPELLVSWLREYFTIVSEEIEATGGTIDKFIGDAVMAFWGAPADQQDHALRACRAVFNCRTRLAACAERWTAEGRPPFTTKFGLNSGDVVVGNLGAENRLNYTVLGDNVNLASRLEGLTKNYGTLMLVSDATLRAAGDEVLARPLDLVAVKGKKHGVTIHELLAPAESATPEERRLADAAKTGFAAYLARDWSIAAARFTEVLAMRPGDPSATRLLESCREYLRQPPPDDWTGLHQFTTK